MAATLGTKTGRNRGAISIAFLCIAVWMLGAAPTSQPSESQIRTWFSQLADSDSAVREKAIQNLMGIRSSDLPLLRKVIDGSLPLLPSQKVVLRDIVTYVFLAGMPYEPMPENISFLGLSWPKDSEDVFITQRVGGFDAYRMLRNGDVIKSIFTPNGEIPVSAATFKNVVNAFRPGQTVEMRIERDGRDMVVPVLLRPRPAALALDTADLKPWQDEREHAADEYWTQHFADLVGEELL